METRFLLHIMICKRKVYQKIFVESGQSYTEPFIMSLLQDYVRVKPNKQTVQQLVNECIEKLANSF